MPTNSQVQILVLAESQMGLDGEYKLAWTFQLNRTALHFAVANASEDAVTFLLKHNARVDIKDKHGMDALLLAAWFGNLNILKMLVEKGSDRKSTNQEGMNMLHCAAQNNHSLIVEYIIKDLQLDLNKPIEQGKKPYHLAVENGHVEMEMLLREFACSTQEKDKEGNTALHLAARNGHSTMVEVLLSDWKQVDEKNEEGQTAFYLAVLGGHQECVQMLLDSGSDINTLAKTNMIALHRAAERNDIYMASLLIEAGTEVNGLNNQMETALHFAVRCGHLSMVQLLIESNCDVNVLDLRNQNPLHLAAEAERADLLELLLIANTDLKQTDKQGKTPLGVAARGNHIIIVDMIIKAERYFAWKETHQDNTVVPVASYPLSFKPDRTTQTNQLRTAMWNLANHHLKPKDWKKLAFHWNFTEEQIKAIGEQWTGTKSYKEHGHRTLLIWLHGILLTGTNPVKGLYEALISIEQKQLADKIRKEINGAETSQRCIVS
ncbi:ankyrin repeat and death domain-containing protein 1A [Callorhinchus milii]|uniref:ankyrin repeat and death domain-containing protein 1A n=1 Tax=Callorhinchus milii TaxID=7868 RepID=UPI0004574BCE|nr:ankyrin repeat and death domain-containing protein 1A [Callorhinchus milii]|eukprot:gi/632974277/ref/XP_007903583.1/ PREDICTED: ankyrin repeat and death domain-containing protein 1B [Callorhinchus milii]